MTSASGGGLRAVLLRQSAQYTIGTFLGLFASVARAGVGARYLAPSEMGLWLAIQVLVGYTTNLHCGVAFGVFRSVPIFLAQGEEQKAANELRTAWTFITGMSFVLLAVGLALGDRAVGDSRWHVIVFANLFAFFNLLKTWYTNAFKAERRFAEISIASGLSSVAALASIALIPRFGVAALLGSAVLQHAVETLFLAVRRDLPRIGISMPALKTQLKVGALTLATNLGVVALTSVDRTVMLRALGPSTAGLFSIGAQISLMVPLAAAVPLSVLTPVFLQRVAKGEDLIVVLQKATDLMSCLFGWVIAIVAITIAPILHLLWPNLLPSALACKLAVLATFPYLLAGPVTTTFFAMNRQWPQVVLLFLSTAVAFGSAITGVHLTGTLAGVSGGTAVGMYFYYGAMVLGAFHVCDRSRWEATTFMVRALMPLGCALLVYLGLELVLSRFWPETSVIRATIASAGMTVAMLPFLRRAANLIRGRA